MNEIISILKEKPKADNDEDFDANPCWTLKESLDVDKEIKTNERFRLFFVNISV